MWTGRPVQARVTLADAGLALYLAVALLVVAVVGGRWLHGMPGVLKVMAVTVWAAGGLQSLGVLAGLLVIGPRKRSRYRAGGPDARDFVPWRCAMLPRRVNTLGCRSAPWCRLG